MIARGGAQSYLIEVKPGMHMKAHLSFLKPYIDDIFNEKSVPLFFHQRTEIDVGGEADEWKVDKVVAHKVEGGKVRFLNTWVGHSPEEATWTDARDFLPRYNVEFVDYCKSNNLKLDIVTHLS